MGDLLVCLGEPLPVIDVPLKRPEEGIDELPA